MVNKIRLTLLNYHQGSYKYKKSEKDTCWHIHVISNTTMIDPQGMIFSVYVKRDETMMFGGVLAEIKFNFRSCT